MEKTNSYRDAYIIRFNQLPKSLGWLENKLTRVVKLQECQKKNLTSQLPVVITALQYPSLGTALISDHVEETARNKSGKITNACHNNNV